MIRLFTPLESMNPTYLQGDDVFAEVIQLHGTTFAEIKEDGYRAQIHKQGAKVQAFTRNMNGIDLELYPELQASLSKLPDCVLDTELIGSGSVGKEGFDAVKVRFRPKISEKGKKEYLESTLTQDYPLELRVFDVLYWKGAWLLDEPLTERRKMVEGIRQERITPSIQRTISDAENLKEWFHNLVGTQYEGLVCKNPWSLYVPGSRTIQWIKLKREETFDLVILGVYFEKNEIGHVLCGTYNEARGSYETLAKVNAKRNGLNKQLEDMLKPRKTKPKNVIIDENMLPERYVSPEKSPVVEVAAMNLQRSKNNHTCGSDGKVAYSLRIGWLKNIREDKDKPMTTKDIIKLYEQVNA